MKMYYTSDGHTIMEISDNLFKDLTTGEVLNYFPANDQSGLMVSNTGGSGNILQMNDSSSVDTNGRIYFDYGPGDNDV